MVADIASESATSVASAILRSREVAPRRKGRMRISPRSGKLHKRLGTARMTVGAKGFELQCNLRAPFTVALVRIAAS
jgi:hypothetical protein